MKNMVLGITGAGGAILAKYALEYLFSQDITVHLILSNTGEKVYKHETGEIIEATIKGVKNVKLYKNSDLFAAISSGSFGVDGMLILPCSMSTAAKIAVGISDTLITRTAAVCLKERTPLILAPRESPFSTTALANLLTLSQNGAYIMPPVPAFYDKKRDFEELCIGIVGRILHTLGVENYLFSKWDGVE
ncbi:MAG: UbiX family flavin prenyltransferase [Defluviitaleaceae bacterium]|nr:UbiX family flavin prenyltransferase [Defluviitaleaceae bacterium]